MATIVLFHHAQGLTHGVRAFADDLRAAGHDVAVPDLFDGRVFDDLDAGIGYAEELGFETIVARGVEATASLPPTIVYAGFSLGALPAQQLAQQRPGARGALLYHGAVPLEEFGDHWPAGVPLQMHVMDADPFDDLPVMRELAGGPDAELFVYPGDRHLFTDRSLEDYDPAAADLATQRTLHFLERWS